MSAVPQVRNADQITDRRADKVISDSVKKGDIVMLRPLGANVVVRADAVEEKTKSGIFIPDTASKENPMQGTVLAVGNGAIVDGKRIPIDLKVGDSIVFAKYCGTQVKF